MKLYLFKINKYKLLLWIGLNPNLQFKILNFILNNKYLKSKNILNSKYYIINKD